MSRAAGNLTRALPLPRSRPGGATALAIWAGLIAASWAWGTYLNGKGYELQLAAPPLHGQWNFELGHGTIVAAVGFAALAVFAGPLVAQRLSWGRLMVASLVGLAVWAVLVALIPGPNGITAPVDRVHEYIGTVPLVATPGDFLGHFLDRIDKYTTHVRSHPPGMVLVLWALERIGLGGSGWAAGATIAVGASAAPAALIALREVAGEARARAATPFLVLLPAVIWIATSADAFYAGVIAWALALLVVAMHRTGRRSDAFALAGGVLFGLAAFLSYGIILLATVPLAVAVATKRVRPLLIAAAGVFAVVAVFAIAGFGWLDGYLETRQQYLASSARNRPFYFFVFNNIAAFAIATGPAVAIALAYLRDRRIWLLAGGGVAALALADISGMSKAEVERIWLPFAFWVALASTALPAARMRWFLGAQAVFTLVVQTTVTTPW